MASQKESGNKGKEVSTNRPYSRSIHSQRSIPGDERGRAPEKQEQGDTIQEPRAKEVVMRESYRTEVTERFNKMREKNREYRHREEELKARLLHAEDTLQEEQTRTKRHIYDIEKLSFALSYVVEPGYLTFAEGIKIDDDAIFVQNDPFCDDPDIEEFLGYTGNEGTRSHDLEREKTQDFVLHGDQLRQISGYFASFTEWSKRFELVTCEDGCRLKTATKNSPISDQVNPPVHALDSKVPTTGIGIVERLRPGILSPINWKLSAVAKPVFPAPFFSSSVICDGH
ncbi:hypothetical protein V8E54_000846 [Elaphomyces granulatus]